MKVSKLKKQLEAIPDDAEVTFRKYLGFDQIALVFSLAGTIWLIYFHEDQGLPA